jgi:hypothetical protein
MQSIYELAEAPSCAERASAFEYAHRCVLDSPWKPLQALSFMQDVLSGIEGGARWKIGPPLEENKLIFYKTLLLSTRYAGIDCVDNAKALRTSKCALRLYATAASQHISVVWQSLAEGKLEAYNLEDGLHFISLFIKEAYDRDAVEIWLERKACAVRRRLLSICATSRDAAGSTASDDKGSSKEKKSPLTNIPVNAVLHALEVELLQVRVLLAWEHAVFFCPGLFTHAASISFCRCGNPIKYLRCSSLLHAGLLPTQQGVEGLRGNREDYYSPENSHLDSVVKTGDGTGGFYLV